MSEDISEEMSLFGGPPADFDSMFAAGPSAETEVVIALDRGLHMRAINPLRLLSFGFASEIELERVDNGRRADCHSVLMLSGLLARRGMRLRIRAVGDDCQDAVEAVADFLRSPTDDHARQNGAPRGAYHVRLCGTLADPMDVRVGNDDKFVCRLGRSIDGNRPEQRHLRLVEAFDHALSIHETVQTEVPIIGLIGNPIGGQLRLRIGAGRIARDGEGFIVNGRARNPRYGRILAGALGDGVKSFDVGLTATDWITRELTPERRGASIVCLSTVGTLPRPQLWGANA